MSISYEFEVKPDYGDINPVADGVDWLRMPLPFALSHINLWILRDGDGIATHLADLGGNTGELLRLHIGQQHVRALGREFQGNGPSDALGCPRNNGGVAF